MDCDDVMLHLAAREPRTLSGHEGAELESHLASCSSCQTLTVETQTEWRWLVRIEPDALEDRALLALPTVDPIVFEATEQLAAGGMGKITRAFDRRLGREIALKETLDRRLRARFEREVQITARLQHPAIVPIYEAGTFPDGSTFYTMRLVPGRTLHEAIEEGRTLEDRLRLMPHLRAVADALAYAHARGVIHRDLKPGNVLVGEFGETVVIDWGLAKEIESREDVEDVEDGPRTSAPDLTRVGSVIGTPCFMSPAQAAGAKADATDDVYALGAILYHLLAGTAPYLDKVESNADALIAATLAGPPTPLRELAAHAPADLRALAERAMARAKQDRFPTARELAAELARFEDGQLLASRDYTLRERLARWVTRHRRVAVAALAGVVAFVALAIVWTRYRRAEQELAIREHGAELTSVYGEVARQASRIDRQFLHIENGLEGLAAAAAWALTGPEPAIELDGLYFDTDFADPDRRPADFTTETAYRWPVSVAHPVIGVAPDTDRVALMPKLRRLSPLRHHMREMVLGAAVGDTSTIPVEDIDRRLLARESPIDYTYVLLPEGVIFMWPGMASLRGDFDVRTASYYTMSEYKRGRRWGAPYVDSTTDPNGDDLVLPCTKGVWSPTGDWLGVAGVDITVTKLVDSMNLGSRQTLRASLVDGRGRKVIDSRDANKRFVASGRDEAIEFSDFDLPDIVTAIRAGQEGIRETTRDHHAIVVAFVRLEAIGWYYVVEVDAATLGT